jgi:tRNA wybutosine-synthesizing protein 1
MAYPEWFAGMFQRADPDFVELKAYMHVGHSRGRLDRDSMPDHDEVRDFTEDVQEHMPDHDVMKEVPVSHVTLLSKTDDTWVPKLKKDSEFWARDSVTGD